MSDIQKPDMSNQWANSGDKTPPATSLINSGWNTGDIPTHTDFNFIAARQDQGIAYLLQKGLVEWDSVTEYQSSKSIVQYNGKVYKCIQTGVNKPPNSSREYWVDESGMSPDRVIVGFDGTGISSNTLIHFSGRDTAGDGGGGPLRFLAGSVAPANGVTVYAVTGGRLVREGFSVFGINVKWAGAGTGVNSDDTDAIHNAYNVLKTTVFGGSLIFPPANYITKSQIVFNDVYFRTLIFEGATICGQSESTSYDAVFKIVNAQNVTIVGAPTVTADSSSFGAVNNPNLYATGFSLQAAPGGEIEPTSGILVYVDVHGMTATKVKNAVAVNAFNDDAQVAEITFHGLKTPFCPNPLYVGGSQTVVNLNGCLITSNPWPALTSPIYSAIIMEGGAVSMAGGELTGHGTVNTPLIDFRPASSAAYGNPYGGFTAAGTLIETKWSLFKVNNPRGLATPNSMISHISLLGCYGYSGDLPAAEAFGSVDDVSYAGKIVIDEACHFYQRPDSPLRAAATINCSTAPNTIVSVGRKAFVHGYPHWMAGVAGGKLLHGMEHAIRAFINTGTAPAGMSNLKPSIKEVGGKFARYQSMYDISTGVITLPANGAVSTMRVEASFLTGTSGDVYLYDITNSRIAAFGQIAGTIANLVATVSDVTPGQQFAIVINVTAPITFSGLDTNSVNIYTVSE